MRHNTKNAPYSQYAIVCVQINVIQLKTLCQHLILPTNLNFYSLKCTRHPCPHYRYIKYINCKQGWDRVCLVGTLCVKKLREKEKHVSTLA